MGIGEAFQEKIRKLGALVGELEAAPGQDGNAAARDLVQLLMEVHGTALQRMIDLVFESSKDGEAIILKAGDDPVVRQLLLLYSLHPESLETRVVKALDAASPRLRKLSSEAELVRISEGAIQVRTRTFGHACGSTARAVYSLVEDCIYDAAPDLVSLEILSPEAEISAGFVSLESLLKHPAMAHEPSARGMEVCGAD